MGIPDGIVDLGAIRRGGEAEEGLERILGHTHYANDCKISLDAGGAVTIEFFFRNNQREYDPVAVAMPAGIFMELAGLAPQVMAEVQAKMTQMAQAQAQRNQAPASMEDAKAARDGA